MSPMVRQPLGIEQSLLGFLRQRPMHGYEIYQQFLNPDGLGMVWRLKPSRLYALLAKLEEGGYITSALEPQEARPPRKVFQLTDSGRDVLLEWVQSPVQHGRQFRLEFLVKLYFAQHEGEATVRHLLENQCKDSRAWLVEQQAHAEALRDEHPYEWLVCQFRISQIEAMLAWLNTCEQTLLTAPNAADRSNVSTKP